MRPPRIALSATLVAALALAACTNPCEELGDRICNCQPEGTFRTSCKTDVKNRVKAAGTTDAREDACSALLGTCPDPGEVAGACDLLNTCQGKVSCGLALPPPEGCNPDGGTPFPDGGTP
jgi:hypothetical protein